MARYRYRVYPTAAQRDMLARTFGCARVVYNDAIRAREDARQRGEKVSDTEVQRRVITAAKHTPEREWLGEVASVALVQACQDARRAYRNFFDSLSGRRKGRRVGPPRFKKKHGRQSIRLTRSGFALHGDRLYVAKVGDLKVAWSRDLPSVPSSVTVIREPDGRYYASFTVDREPQPLPLAEREVGIDVGLASLAVLSDGTVIANPRYLRRAERKLARLQRRLSRKQKGSRNRAKARHRVAAAHRKVRDRRLDHAHKTALAIVRDSQAVYAEDIAVSGLARTRLAKCAEPISLTELNRHVLLSQSATSRLADRLAGRGLISRCTDPQDRRGVLLSLTGAGRALQARIGTRHARDVARALFSTLNDTEIAQLEGICRKLADRAARQWDPF
jgi:putative transposase